MLIRDTHKDTGCGKDTARDSSNGEKELIQVSERRSGKQGLLQKERGSKGHGEGPADDTTGRKPGYTRSRFETSSPVHEGRSSQHARVHGEARRKVCSTCMKVSRTKDQGQDEEDTDPRVNCEADYAVEQGLA